MILILGENVYWHLGFIDQIYTNIGTNQFDLFIVVFVTEFVLIWGIGAMWITGFFGIMERLLRKL